MSWWYGRRSARSRISSVSLWLCVGWASIGATCGSVELLNADRCPPGWPEVADDMDRLEAAGEARVLRLYLAQLLEHCQEIEDMVE